MARKYLPLCNSSKFSNEKAEKVVKPPQTPVARNNFQLYNNDSSFILSAMMRPIKKQPIIFTANVGHGKNLELIIKDIPYLSIEPIPPPRATNKKFLSIVLFYRFPEKVYFRSTSHLPFMRTSFNLFFDVLLYVLLYGKI